MKIDTDWLAEAIGIISKGMADRLTKGNITVYRVKNIIRVDIKEDYCVCSCFQCTNRQ